MQTLPDRRSPALNGQAALLRAFSHRLRAQCSGLMILHILAGEDCRQAMSDKHVASIGIYTAAATIVTISCGCPPSAVEEGVEGKFPCFHQSAYMACGASRQ